MADFCTMITVVPTGGIDRSSAGPLGCGPTDLCGVAFAFAEDVGVEPVPWLDVDTPVADDAAGAGADPLLDDGRLEAPPPAAEVPDDPPHAASSSTSDPSPVAAAHPLLRITSPISFGWLAVFRASRSWPQSEPVRGVPGPSGARPGNAGALKQAQLPLTMLLADSLITCHSPSMPLPVAARAFAPLRTYSG